MALSFLEAAVKLLNLQEKYPALEQEINVSITKHPPKDGDFGDIVCEALRKSVITAFSRHFSLLSSWPSFEETHSFQRWKSPANLCCITVTPRNTDLKPLARWILTKQGSVAVRILAMGEGGGLGAAEQRESRIRSPALGPQLTFNHKGIAWGSYKQGCCFKGRTEAAMFFVLCFTETWLTPDSPDPAIQPKGFSIHHMNCKESSGKGKHLLFGQRFKLSSCDNLS